MTEKNVKPERIVTLVDNGTNHEKHGYQPKYDIKGNPPQGGSVVAPPSSSTPSAPKSGPATPTTPQAGKKD